MNNIKQVNQIVREEGHKTRRNKLTQGLGLLLRSRNCLASNDGSEAKIGRSREWATLEERELGKETMPHGERDCRNDGGEAR